MKKTARLEIRLSQEDKELLAHVAVIENCTVTSLLQDYIQELLDKLKLVTNRNKPKDSDEYPVYPVTA